MSVDRLIKPFVSASRGLVFLACVLLLSCAAGCAASGSSSLENDKVDCIEESLEKPPAAMSVWDMETTEGGKELLALCDAASLLAAGSNVANYGEEDYQDASTMVWRSKNQGSSWERATLVPADLQELKLGVYAGDVNAKGEVLAVMGTYSAMTPEEVYAGLYRVYPDGTYRQLEGFDEDAFEGMAGVCCLSSGRALFCGFDSHSAEVSLIAYLYDENSQMLLKKEEIGGEIGGFYGCSPFGDDAFIVIGSDGAIVFDASTGERRTLPSGISELLADNADCHGYGGASLYSDGKLLYSISERGVRSVDSQAGEFSRVMDFDAAMLGAGGWPLSFAKCGDSFLCSFTAGSDPLLSRFSPSEPKGAVGGSALEVYTLKPNPYINQSLALYLKDHPEENIRVTVGIDEEGAETEEDAVRALNARMLAGDGPDILVLDGLPKEAYEGQGLLVDLGEVVDSEECFENILSTGLVDGEFCSVPTRFAFYAAQGLEEDLFACNDVAALGDHLAQLAEGGGITADFTHVDARRGIPKLDIYAETLYDVYSPWLLANGFLDVDLLRDYLEQMGRMSSALGSSGIEPETTGDNSLYDGAWDAVLGAGECSIGKIENVLVASTVAQGSIEDPYLVWSQLLSDSGLFLPLAQVGVCAGSSKLEDARDVVAFLLSEEAQSYASNPFDTGFPIRVDSFEQALSGEGVAEGGVIITLYAQDGSGTVVEVESLGDEAVRQWVVAAESLEMSVLDDAVVKRIVMGNLQKYLDGDLTLDEAVAASKQKIDLYLAE